jgi:hypothetical protein
MTVDLGSLTASGAGSALHDSWREAAAVRALDRAETAVVAALRRLAEADEVDWVGGPAARYRCELEGVVDRTRAARALLAAAVRAAEEHALAVRRLGAVTLVGPPSIGDHRPPWPWSEPVTAELRSPVPSGRTP